MVDVFRLMMMKFTYSRYVQLQMMYHLVITYKNTFTDPVLHQHLSFFLHQYLDFRDCIKGIKRVYAVLEIELNRVFLANEINKQFLTSFRHGLSFYVTDV